MSRFWRNWLTVWCCATALFGIILAGGGFEATSGPVRLVFNSLQGPGELDLNAHMRFILGVLGPITVGWSLTMWTAIKVTLQLDRQAARPIWMLLIASVACWFIVDSCVSINTGFWRNTIPNVAYMATFLLPIVRSGVLKTR